MHIRLLFIAITSAALGNCRSPFGVVCTDIFKYGLHITVADSATGSPPLEATLTATSGSFVEVDGPRGPLQQVVNGPPVLVLYAAGERPGWYTVLVQAPGYLDWRRAPVRVTADQCHVRPVEITARLQRSGN